MSDSEVRMNRTETLSPFGKNYCLKHIRLVREFCFRAKRSLAENNLNATNFLLSRAERVVKGLNPFCRYATPNDRQFFIQAKESLARFFFDCPDLFAKGDTSLIKNRIEEIIIETIDLEKNFLGVSFAQLSQKVLLENNWYPP